MGEPTLKIAIAINTRRYVNDKSTYTDGIKIIRTLEFMH